MLDTHVHFWKYHPVKDAWINDDMKVIQRDFAPADLEPLFEANGVDGCVAVQASQSEDENRFLLDLASQSDIIRGIVGWVDLRNGNLEERLQYYSQYELIKGWRHVVQAEPDGFLLQQNFIDGVKALKKFNYTYDILITYNQYPDAIKFVEKFSGQPFVIDHLGKPDIKSKEINNFKSYIKEIAQHPDVKCKVSGMVTEADWQNWTEDDIFRYLDVVFEHFGPSKLMYGSDWPVVNVAGGYERWISLVRKYLKQFNQQEQDSVTHLNAIDFYQLKV